jgi:hypothetical protein
MLLLVLFKTVNEIQNIDEGLKADILGVGGQPWRINVSSVKNLRRRSLIVIIEKRAILPCCMPI